MRNFAADMENRIKDIIREKGYTMVDFANVLGVSRETLFRIIKRPSTHTLERLSKELKVPVWQFFVKTDNVTKVVCPHCGKEITIMVE